MRVIEKNSFNLLFPMEVRCQRVEDRYGFAYGEVADFCGSRLEIEANDIKQHHWSKYPDYKGVDYGVICPVCKQFVVISPESIPQVIKDNAEQISVR